MEILKADATGRITRFSMRRPDNWHGHVRKGRRMEAVVATSADVYGRMTIMPNTGPTMTPEEAIVDRFAIIDALIKQGFSQERAERFPRMTVYLHKGTTESDIRQARTFDMDYKFYPKNPVHGTTGAQAGVPSLIDVDDQIALMEKHGVRLLVHGESALHPNILDLERYFVQDQMVPTVSRHPGLKIVMEHITTKEAVQFVCDASNNVTATATPQHLWYSINSLFEGGLRPFRYCLPLYKHPADMKALIDAIMSGSRKFCSGDDTAPHPEHGPKGKAKLADCGCAGAYVAPVSVPMYVEAFERAGALDERFENFMSVNGAVTRRLPLNCDEIVLERSPWIVPDRYDYGDGESVVPLCAGETLQWQVASC